MNGWMEWMHRRAGGGPGGVTPHLKCLVILVHEVCYPTNCTKMPRLFYGLQFFNNKPPLADGRPLAHLSANGWMDGWMDE